MAKNKENKENGGFDLGIHAHFLMIFTVVLIAGVLVVSGAPSSNGTVRSFEHVSLFGGTDIPGNAAFSGATRVSPFGPEETISACNKNVLKTGWFVVVDHDSPEDPFLGVFNTVRGAMRDANSVTLTYTVDGQPLDVTATPTKKFETVLGAPFSCDDLFADFGLSRKGDEGCYAKTFAAPLDLAPGTHELYTQFFYGGELLFDNTKTLNVEACMQ